MSPLRRGGLALERWLPADAAVAYDVDVQLAALGPDWRICRGVRPALRLAVLDYVVIGPGGLFVVAALPNDAAAVWVRGENLLVDGAWAPQLQDSRSGAQALATGLSASYGRDLVAIAVVALATDAARCAIQRQPHGAHVAPPGTLTGWLLAQPVRFTAAEVHGLHQYVRDPALWTRRAS